MVDNLGETKVVMMALMMVAKMGYLKVERMATWLVELREGQWAD